LPGESAPTTIVNTPTETESAVVNLVATNMEKQNLVPSKFEGFVPWGHFKDIKQIVKSGIFYPVFVTGLSGNGKTLMIEQVHADMNKELIRVNITIETDEDDLLGGFRLVNGETKFVPGPVIEAMEKGCTLLLDECDLGSNKLMCLQPVLEGKGVYLKKVNKWITPKDGFNVMATANTKGKGSEDGRFIGTNILNDVQSEFIFKKLKSISFNFPDPWFKKRHYKRRIIQPEFINLLSNSLEKGSLIFIKTDVKELFDYMDCTISSNPYFKTIDKKDFNYSGSFNPNQVKTYREKYVIVNQLDIFERIYIKI